MTFRERLFKMVSVGVIDDRINQCYDVVSIGALLLNLAAAFANTYDTLHFRYGDVFALIETVTVVFFAIDYVLRLVTAKFLYSEVKEATAIRKYMLSFDGIVDVLSFVPYFLPVFFPAGVSAFRMIRAVRILRLFRINAYYDSLNVIAEVLVRKRQQLLSSVFIILVLMLGSSLCMYSIEHTLQPDVFQNAFSGLWWSVSTLLTVGYGDIYPITTIGKLFGIFISFLGVGMVAIPTGIISAGFVEQYQRLESLGSRDGQKAPEYLRAVLGDDDMPIALEVEALKEKHRWVGRRLREIDGSEGRYVLMVVRDGKRIKPENQLVLESGDRIYWYTKE